MCILIKLFKRIKRHKRKYSLRQDTYCYKLSKFFLFLILPKAISYLSN